MSGGHVVDQSEAFAVSRQPMRGLCNCAKLCLSCLEVIGAKEGESLHNREPAILNKSNCISKMMMGKPFKHLFFKLCLCMNQSNRNYLILTIRF